MKKVGEIGRVTASMFFTGMGEIRGMTVGKPSSTKGLILLRQQHPKTAVEMGMGIESGGYRKHGAYHVSRTWVVP